MNLGNLADGPDRAARIQWGLGVHSLCTIPSHTENKIDCQIHLHALLQTLEECLSKVLRTSHETAGLLKHAKKLQITHARKAFAKTSHPLPDDITYDEALDRIKNGDKTLRVALPT